ncbi:MAG: T9SS type A sorting domain-containing protein [Bacteroidia bacterium]|nr:T9SS type A sorting domain-containing protein [Bacteroidia bacterium]
MSSHPILNFFAFLIFSAPILHAQTGPNSPATTSNNASVGSLAWTNPGNAISNNNTYATVTNKGLTNYIAATGFGFSISIPSSISGIQLEVERSTNSPTAVAVLNNWTNGLTKAISAGLARCLIVGVFMENGVGARDVTAITYGGQSMTQITEITVGTAAGFTGKIEWWRLMETGIASATSTAFSLTFNAATLDQNWEAVSSAVFQYVDQVIPVSAFTGIASNNATNPITLSPALATFQGGMSISGVYCGNNTTPASAVNGTNTYLINSGFTEVIDTYSANSGFTGSGGSFQIANKATATSGTEAPTYTFAGTANRQLASCIHLQRLRECDQSVRLLKGGVITGNNYAQTTSAWTTTDTYTTYGGAADLWGTTWTEAEVNANNFGAVFSASVQNGTARVDHLRMTIYSFSTLPIDLLEFFGECNNGQNRLYWRTASEKNNKRFEIEKSTDGITFTIIGSREGKKNSQIIIEYEFLDTTSSEGLSYYRLKQIDLDDTFRYQRLISVSCLPGAEEPLVFPNPSCDGVFSMSPVHSLKEGVAIYSNDLKLIKTLKVDSNELQVSLQELAEGIYYLIYTHEGKQKIKRLHKQCGTK